MDTTRAGPRHAGPTSRSNNLAPWAAGQQLKPMESRFRFQMVSMEFFIDIILPAALWSWG